MAWLSGWMARVFAVVLLAGAVLCCGCTRSSSTGGGAGSGVAKTAMERGDKLVASGDKQKAIAAYSEAINLDPQHKPAYVRRGMLLNETGDPHKALADFSKAIELDPRDSYPYEQRAQIYRKVLKDQAKADADAEKAAAIRERLRDQRRENYQKMKRK